MRTILKVALVSLALASCDQMRDSIRNREDNAIQDARFFQHRETGMCVARIGSGNTTTYSPVECTPEILARVRK